LSNSQNSSGKQISNVEWSKTNEAYYSDGALESADHVFQEVPVEDFSCEVSYIVAKVTPAEAKSRMIDSISQKEFKFPNNIQSVDVVSQTRGVLVPYWARSGTIDAKWQAIGILVESWTVACSRCRGSGRIGRGKKNTTCPVCHGSRSERRSKDNKTSEKGSASISLGPELVPNVNQFFGFKFAPNPHQDVIKLSAKQREDFRCLKPKDPSLENEQTRLTEDLVRLWKSKVLNDLGSYDRVESLSMLDDENAGSSHLSVVLYPAYLTWYTVGKKHFYIVCDAITGEIQLPSVASYVTDKIVDHVLELGLIVLAIGVLVALLK
jgi:hypothetical protein